MSNKDPSLIVAFIGSLFFSFILLLALFNQPTYELVANDASGREYILDYDLSADDCIQSTTMFTKCRRKDHDRTAEVSSPS